MPQRMLKQQSMCVCLQGVAANLGPEQTKLWLLTSIAAVGMQIVTEPFKMLFSVALLQLVVSHLPDLSPTSPPAYVVAVYACQA